MILLRFTLRDICLYAHPYRVYQVRRYPADHTDVGHGLRVWRARPLYPVDDDDVGVVSQQYLLSDLLEPRSFAALQEPVCDEISGHRRRQVGRVYRAGVPVVQVLTLAPVVARVQTVSRRYFLGPFREHAHRT